jgi:hypothetical protein
MIYRGSWTLFAGLPAERAERREGKFEIFGARDVRILGFARVIGRSTSFEFYQRWRESR